MSRRTRSAEVEPAAPEPAEAAAIRAEQTQQWATVTRAGWRR